MDSTLCVEDTAAVGTYVHEAGFVGATGEATAVDCAETLGRALDVLPGGAVVGGSIETGACGTVAKGIEDPRTSRTFTEGYAVGVCEGGGDERKGCAVVGRVENSHVS